MWYIAYVKSCQERSTAARLSELGIENYVPTQQVRRRWSDRWKIVEQVLLRGMVFLNCDENTRLQLFNSVPSIYAYMCDKNTHRPIIVPEVQMHTFQFMVSNAIDSIVFNASTLLPGDKVRVISGPMQGLIGELIAIEGKAHLAIQIANVGTLSVSIHETQVEIIK